MSKKIFFDHDHEYLPFYSCPVNSNGTWNCIHVADLSPGCWQYSGVLGRFPHNRTVFIPFPTTDPAIDRTTLFFLSYRYLSRDPFPFLILPNRRGLRHSWQTAACLQGRGTPGICIIEYHRPIEFPGRGGDLNEH